MSDSLVGLVKSTFVTLTSLLFRANDADQITQTKIGASVLLSTARQEMYVQRNIKAHSCNHCCHGEEIRVHPITGHEDEEVELRYSSTVSLTSALSGGR